MAFHEVPYPEPDKFIEPPVEPGSLAFVVVPSLKLFSDQMIYWRTKHTEADRSGNATVRRIAHESTKSLRQAAMGRYAIEHMQMTSTYEMRVAGEWYVESVLAMAYTRMLREILEMNADSSALDFGIKAEELSAGFDFHANDPHRSGIHAKEDFCRGVLGVEPPVGNGPVYYEGESVYLRASRPAAPTIPFERDYHTFYKTKFKPEDHISFVPRIKTAFWSGDPPQTN